MKEIKGQRSTTMLSNLRSAAGRVGAQRDEQGRIGRGERINSKRDIGIVVSRGRCANVA